MRMASLLFPCLRATNDSNAAISPPHKVDGQIGCVVYRAPTQSRVTKGFHRSVTAVCIQLDSQRVFVDDENKL